MGRDISIHTENPRRKSDTEMSSDEDEYHYGDADSDDGNFDCNSFKYSFSRHNDLLSELLDNRAITKEKVCNILNELMKKLNSGDTKYSIQDIGEAIILFGYLLNNDHYPIWILYN